MKTKQWYKIQNKADDVVDIFVYDEISYVGVSAQDFISELSEINASQINLHINSPGGLVFDGFAIYDAIRQHSAKVTTYVDGIAASIASIIALAGDEIIMAENAFLMIHSPWSFVAGGAADMRKEANLLDKIEVQLVNVYAKRTGLDATQIAEWVTEETWFNADEAKQHGFIDSISDGAEPEDKHNLSVFGKVPDAAKETWHNEVLSLRKLEQALRDAGVSRSEAKSLLGNSRRDAVDDVKDDGVSDSLDNLLDKFN